MSKPTASNCCFDVDYCGLEMGILAQAMSMPIRELQYDTQLLKQVLSRLEPDQTPKHTIFEPWKLCSSKSSSSLPHMYYVSKGENGLEVRDPWEEACSPRPVLAGPWKDQWMPSDAADPYDKTAIAKLIQAETGPFALARQRAAFGACEGNDWMSVEDVKHLLETLRGYEDARGGMSRPRQEALDLADCWDEECAAYERMRSQK